MNEDRLSRNSVLVNGSFGESPAYSKSEFPKGCTDAESGDSIIIVSKNLRTCGLIKDQLRRRSSMLSNVKARSFAISSDVRMSSVFSKLATATISGCSSIANIGF